MDAAEASGEHLVGSPFSLVVSSGELDSANSYFELESDGSDSVDDLRAGNRYRFRVRLFDRFGNRVTQQQPKLELALLSQQDDIEYQTVVSSSIDRKSVV